MSTKPTLTLVPSPAALSYAEQFMQRVAEGDLAGIAEMTDRAVQRAELKVVPSTPAPGPIVSDEL